MFLLLNLSCAAGNPETTPEDPAGFWLGVWHGMISVIAFVIGLFNHSVEVYERNNSGPLYDLGFLIGILGIWGGGSKVSGDRRRKRCDDKQWEVIGAKVEAKIQRKIREWAEAEPDEDWNIVEAKAEEKLKRKIREWAKDNGGSS